jgi:putative nucleotidyltransferase with HDIG domain
MMPSRAGCIKLLKKYGYYTEGVPISHVLSVEETSLKIADMLIQKGIKIDKDIISRAALLHDIGKGSNKNNKDHAIIGYQICKKERIDIAVCIAVKNHDVNGVLTPLKTWEEKIIAYSDKICNKEVIGLEGRFNDWKARCPESYDKIKHKMDVIHHKSQELEKEILNKLELTPKELYEILKKNTKITR